MRAVLVTEPGGPQQLTIADVPDPVPGAGELLIRVVAAGVNRADILQRQGHYPPPKGITDILGLEVAGEVAGLGDGVEGWAVGDPVVALLAGGGYAERVVVPAGQCLAPPDGMDLVTAASVIEVAATVVSNLDEAGLRPGETFLMHGGAGGVGSFAIPYAAALGATVIATAGSQSKLEYCRRLGAQTAIDYHEDWVAAVRTATSGRGVDVVLDIMGAKYLEPNVEVLARGGRLVVIGLQGGRRGTLDLARLLSKSAQIRATSLRQRPVAEKIAVVQRVGETVWPLLASQAIPLGTLRLFSLDQVREAHEHLVCGESTGKLVLTL